jgi:ATP-dependent Clp protease ATP-binding subunit ClpA
MTKKNEVALDPSLEAKLKRMRLWPEFSDANTVKLRNVPASERWFSKVRTNLLVKRSVGAMPSIVCVDDDLEYTGKDRLLSQAFAMAPMQEGWRVLTLDSFSGYPRADLSEGLALALDILGVDEDASGAVEAPPTRKSKLLEAWAEDLTNAVRAGRSDATLFRDEEVEQVAGSTLAWQGRLPLVIGDSGTGKTNLLHGVARLLGGRGQWMLAVNVGAMLAGTLFENEKEKLLAGLFQEAEAAKVVLALEQAEWALLGSSRCLVLLRDALDRGLRMICTTTPSQEERFMVHPISSRLDVVRLNEMCASDTLRILEQLRPRLVAHHGVEIDQEVEAAVVERSATLAGALPGKAVQLLDAAAARAQLCGAAKVTLIDVYVVGARMPGLDGN